MVFTFLNFIHFIWKLSKLFLQTNIEGAVTAMYVKMERDTSSLLTLFPVCYMIHGYQNEQKRRCCKAPPGHQISYLINFGKSFNHNTHNLSCTSILRMVSVLFLCPNVFYQKPKWMCFPVRARNTLRERRKVQPISREPWLSRDDVAV